MKENTISGKYTPPAGKTLLIVGQDLDAVAGYVEQVWETPGGVTTYTNISEGGESLLLYGLSSTVNYGSGDVNGQKCLDDYPHSALAIGLYLVDHGFSRFLAIPKLAHQDGLQAFKCS